MSTTFSKNISQTIDDFAAGLQIDQFVRADNGAVSFQVDRVGMISIYPAQDGNRTLVSLKRNPAHPPHADDLDDFLKLAQWEPYIRAPINAGMTSDGGLLLIASLNNDNFDRQQIESCLDRLTELHRQSGIN